MRCTIELVMVASTMSKSSRKSSKSRSRSTQILKISWFSLPGSEVRDIYDLMYVLGDAKPGEEATFVAERGDERIEGSVTFGTSSRTR